MAANAAFKPTDEVEVIKTLRDMINDPQLEHDQITRADVYSDSPARITGKLTQYFC